jgi:hypothetical protein
MIIFPFDVSLNEMRFKINAESTPYFMSATFSYPKNGYLNTLEVPPPETGPGNLIIGQDRCYIANYPLTPDGVIIKAGPYFLAGTGWISVSAPALGLVWLDTEGTLVPYSDIGDPLVTV